MMTNHMLAREINNNFILVIWTIAKSDIYIYIEAELVLKSSLDKPRVVDHNIGGSVCSITPT